MKSEEILEGGGGGEGSLRCYKHNCVAALKLIKEIQ